jgi:hypothetical protein
LPFSFLAGNVVPSGPSRAKVLFSRASLIVQMRHSLKDKSVRYKFQRNVECELRVNVDPERA